MSPEEHLRRVQQPWSNYGVQRHPPLYAEPPRPPISSEEEAPAFQDVTRKRLVVTVAVILTLFFAGMVATRTAADQATEDYREPPPREAKPQPVWVSDPIGEPK
jgi:hypothetical protein